MLEVKPKNCTFKEYPGNVSKNLIYKCIGHKYMCKTAKGSKNEIRKKKKTTYKQILKRKK